MPARWSRKARSQRALEEYKALAAYYPGAEAAVRYARCCAPGAEQEDRDEVLRALLEQAAIAPRHYRRAQEEWLKQAERELAAL